MFQYDLVGETNRTGDNDPKKRAIEIIAKLDVTGDKKLNKYEFIAGYFSINYIYIYISEVSMGGPWAVMGRHSFINFCETLRLKTFFRHDSMRQLLRFSLEIRFVDISTFCQ